MTEGRQTRCKDCAHGQFPVEGIGKQYFTDGGRLGCCTRWRQGYCEWVPAQVKDNECLVEDDEGWAMRIGPDFGCVLFEAKPTEA